MKPKDHPRPTPREAVKAAARRTKDPAVRAWLRLLARGDRPE